MHRRFHATRVRSSGFTIQVRLRIDRADATPDVMAALPRIQGFADPPLLDEGPEPPPLTDASYNLWTIELDVTPFATDRVPETCAQFRGVFVQRYSPKDQPQSQPASLVLVGAFGP